MFVQLFVISILDSISKIISKYNMNLSLFIFYNSLWKWIRTQDFKFSNYKILKEYYTQILFFHFTITCYRLSYHLLLSLSTFFNFNVGHSPSQYLLICCCTSLICIPSKSITFPLSTLLYCFYYITLLWSYWVFCSIMFSLLHSLKYSNYRHCIFFSYRYDEEANKFLKMDKFVFI